ncbi:hypothetical protein RchiOBHm_Chr2g0085101 [Rosa chinensis]|uniref:Uncharacterized protein n=1 Tax=Rosa chinensis TaxID=74649 RepID=A0A2P6RI17_ROSCH|nr:hypothetical protein RchiOBHm_Chr2g0085101 [Rosa chinensis]
MPVIRDVLYDDAALYGAGIFDGGNKHHSVAVRQFNSNEVFTSIEEPSPSDEPTSRPHVKYWF